MRAFIPLRPLRNPHLMTIAGAFWRRHFPDLPPGASRLFDTEPGLRVLAQCHWQKNPRAHPTLVLLHGLEGSSESAYMRGTAEHAWLAGFNAVRLNQRNCGGTNALAPGLYHSGLSGDLTAVVRELIERDGLSEIFVAGFSMGGNIVLKMAGEFGASAPAALRGFVAVAPSLDLAVCADAVAAPQNFIYRMYFVRRLKRRILEKARLFPGVYRSLDGLRRVRTIREFDDAVTAPRCGFRDATDYYTRSSALRLAAEIRRPTLIIAAQDDPLVPFASFDHPAIKNNPHVALLAPRHGGHCTFISREPGRNRFWAEARILDFCRAHLASRAAAQTSQ